MHRDLKPKNVLISIDGRAKVADFGESTRLDVSAAREHAKEHGGMEALTMVSVVCRQSSAASLTISGVLIRQTMVGTPMFAAPEILEGKAYSVRQHDCSCRQSFLPPVFSLTFAILVPHADQGRCLLLRHHARGNGTRGRQQVCKGTVPDLGPVWGRRRLAP